MYKRQVETAKANDLNIYNYFKHLLTEIPKHMDDTDFSFLNSLLPWSKQLPAECRKKKKLKPSNIVNGKWPVPRLSTQKALKFL